MARPYTISDKRALELSGIVVLRELEDPDRPLGVGLEGFYQELAPVLDWLLACGLVADAGGDRYELSAAGRQAVERFLLRYEDLVRNLDVYSAVDVEEGLFAFERCFSFEDDLGFEEYLAGEQWEDLRVAVAELKGIDPIECVFMGYLGEGRVGPRGSVPGSTLLVGPHWEEIAQLCNEAVAAEDLAFEEEGDAVSGSDVLSQIVREGAELNLELKRFELERKGERSRPALAAGEAASIEAIERAYEPYLDPSYVPPFWLGSWYSQLSRPAARSES